MMLHEWSILPYISGGLILHLGHFRAMVMRMVGYKTCDPSSEDVLHIHVQVSAIDSIAIFRYPTVLLLSSFLIRRPELLRAPATNSAVYVARACS
jgi:hypothetical protein